MTSLKNIFAVAMLIFSVSLPVCAQNTSAQEDKKAKLQKEIALIDKQLAAVEKESKSASGSLELIRKKVAKRKALVAESEAEINTCNQKIRNAQREIDKLQAKVDTLNLYYGKLLRSTYKSRDAKSWYMYLLSSDNISQAIRRLSYFKSLSSNMRQQGEKLKEARNELEEHKKELGRIKKEAENVKAQRQKELDSISKEEAQAAALVSKLKKNKKKYTDEIAAKRRQIDALDREIRAIIAKATGKSAKPIDYTLAKEFAANKGILPWPAEGVVVEEYGQHYHPVFTSLKLPFNKGVEIAVSPGADVKSVFDGVVSHVIVLPSYNVCVLVQHGDYFSFYCKLKKADVKVGDKVKTGQKIGNVDTIRGSSQLHFEIWKGQDHMNPERWLRPVY